MTRLLKSKHPEDLAISILCEQLLDILDVFVAVKKQNVIYDGMFQVSSYPSSL